MRMGLNISLSIWSSYINAILECLQIKKHCEAIIISFALHTSKKAHMAKLEDLLKALLKNGLKILQGNVSYLKQSYNIWEMLYL